jgi:cytochrome d ubiquinol oxidase subunit I
MPTFVAVSHIETSGVILTFWLFAITFSILLAAELRIMFKQIKKGTTEGGVSHV